jgi:predicted amidohydrolase
MFAFLNIVGMGMVSNDLEQNHQDMQVDPAVGMGREHEDVIVGMKTAHYTGPEWISVDRMLEAGRRLGKPCMVDFGLFPSERPFYELVTQRMSAGDIATHMFLGDVPWIGPDGQVPGICTRRASAASSSTSVTAAAASTGATPCRPSSRASIPTRSPPICTRGV